MKSPFRRAWDRIVWTYRKKFQGKHQVFVRAGPFPPEQNPGVRFFRYETFSEVPESIRRAIVERDGERALQKDEMELADHSVMWVALVGEALAGVRHSRRGRYFRQWFVPLTENDVVIFRGRTYPEFRGRGISPSMHRHIMNTELSGEDRAFADCAVYNKSSRRSFQKAGYRMIATMKPIKRETALGKD